MPRFPESTIPLTRLAMLAVLACVTGCAAVRPPVVVPAPLPPPVPVCPPPVAPVLICEPSPPAEPSAADLAMRRFFAYQDQLRGLQGADLMRELGRIGEPNGRPQAAVEFSLVLGQTRNPSDTVRAMNILDPVIKSTAPEAAPWQPMARLLFARFAEQRRVEEQVDRLNNQARENQRKTDQLNEKLEALKAIERSLNTRGGPASNPAPKPP